ncbi:hypothetical protein V8C86DRAFT_3145031 [Haematococcus lacustris]
MSQARDNPLFSPQLSPVKRRATLPHSTDYALAVAEASMLIQHQVAQREALQLRAQQLCNQGREEQLCSQGGEGQEASATTLDTVPGNGVGSSVGKQSSSLPPQLLLPPEGPDEQEAAMRLSPRGSSSILVQLAGLPQQDDLSGVAGLESGWLGGSTDDSILVQLQLLEAVAGLPLAAQFYKAGRPTPPSLSAAAAAGHTTAAPRTGDEWLGRGPGTGQEGSRSNNVAEVPGLPWGAAPSPAPTNTNVVAGGMWGAAPHSPHGSTDRQHTPPQQHRPLAADTQAGWDPSLPCPATAQPVPDASSPATAQPWPHLAATPATTKPTSAHLASHPLLDCGTTHHRRTTGFSGPQAEPSLAFSASTLGSPPSPAHPPRPSSPTHSPLARGWDAASTHPAPGPYPAPSFGGALAGQQLSCQAGQLERLGQQLLGQGPAGKEQQQSSLVAKGTVDPPLQSSRSARAATPPRLLSSHPPSPAPASRQSQPAPAALAALPKPKRPAWQSSVTLRPSRQRSPNPLQQDPGHAASAQLPGPHPSSRFPSAPRQARARSLSPFGQQGMGRQAAPSPLTAWQAARDPLMTPLTQSQAWCPAKPQVIPPAQSHPPAASPPPHLQQHSHQGRLQLTYTARAAAKAVSSPGTTPAVAALRPAACHRYSLQGPVADGPAALPQLSQQQLEAMLAVVRQAAALRARQGVPGIPPMTLPFADVETAAARPSSAVAALRGEYTYPTDPAPDGAISQAAMPTVDSATPPAPQGPVHPADSLTSWAVDPTLSPQLLVQAEEPAPSPPPTPPPLPLPPALPPATMPTLHPQPSQVPPWTLPTPPPTPLLLHLTAGVHTARAPAEGLAPSDSAPPLPLPPAPATAAGALLERPPALSHALPPQLPHIPDPRPASTPAGRASTGLPPAASPPPPPAQLLPAPHPPRCHRPSSINTSRPLPYPLSLGEPTNTLPAVHPGHSPQLSAGSWGAAAPAAVRGSWQQEGAWVAGLSASTQALHRLALLRASTQSSNSPDRAGLFDRAAALRASSVSRGSLRDRLPPSARVAPFPMLDDSHAADLGLEAAPSIQACDDTALWTTTLSRMPTMELPSPAASDAADLGPGPDCGQHSSTLPPLPAQQVAEPQVEQVEVQQEQEQQQRQRKQKQQWQAEEEQQRQQEQEQQRLQQHKRPRDGKPGSALYLPDPSPALPTPALLHCVTRPNESMTGAVAAHPSSHAVSHGPAPCPTAVEQQPSESRDERIAAHSCAPPAASRPGLPPSTHSHQSAAGIPPLPCATSPWRHTSAVHTTRGASMWREVEEGEGEEEEEKRDGEEEGEGDEDGGLGMTDEEWLDQLTAGLVDERGEGAGGLLLEEEEEEEEEVGSRQQLVLADPRTALQGEGSSATHQATLSASLTLHCSDASEPPPPAPAPTPAPTPAPPPASDDVGAAPEYGQQQEQQGRLADQPLWQQQLLLQRWPGGQLMHPLHPPTQLASSLTALPLHHRPQIKPSAPGECEVSGGGSEGVAAEGGGGGKERQEQHSGGPAEGSSGGGGGWGWEEQQGCASPTTSTPVQQPGRHTQGTRRRSASSASLLSLVGPGAAPRVGRCLTQQAACTSAPNAPTSLLPGLSPRRCHSPRSLPSPVARIGSEPLLPPRPRPPRPALPARGQLSCPEPPALQPAQLAAEQSPSALLPAPDVPLVPAAMAGPPAVAPTAAAPAPPPAALAALSTLPTAQQPTQDLETEPQAALAPPVVPSQPPHQLDSPHGDIRLSPSPRLIPSPTPSPRLGSGRAPSPHASPSPSPYRGLSPSPCQRSSPSPGPSPRSAPGSPLMQRLGTLLMQGVAITAAGVLGAGLSQVARGDASTPKRSRQRTGTPPPASPRVAACPLSTPTSPAQHLGAGPARLLPGCPQPGPGMCEVSNSCDVVTAGQCETSPPPPGVEPRPGAGACEQVDMEIRSWRGRERGRGATPRRSMRPDESELRLSPKELREERARSRITSRPDGVW